MVRDDAVDGQRRPLTGTPEQIRDDLANYAKAGVDEEAGTRPYPPSQLRPVAPASARR